MSQLRLLVVSFTLLSIGILAQKNNSITSIDPVETIQLGDLKVVFINNEPYGEHHRGGYNGISELIHSANDSNIFVPFYAGFNLEHIFAGDSLTHLFEPRNFPMKLNRISKNSVELYQAETPLSHVESWTTFKVVAPHYIDINFRCIIKSSEFFKHGYAGIFWASYINAPQDKKIYFLGHQKDKNKIKWIGVESVKHGVESTHIGKDDNFKLFTVPEFNVTLANNYSNYLFSNPFYYGRFDNMVIAYLFSQPKEGIIRFSQSPTGGGPENPAWDFQFIIPDFEVGKEYSFKTRIVYTVWKGEDNILEEYNKWKN